MRGVNPFWSATSVAVFLHFLLFSAADAGTEAINQICFK